MKPHQFPKLWLLMGFILCGVVASFSHRINDYYLAMTINVGINIILAVSLNLVNGYTGQFSLGHAGFMSVGAYTAAAITTKTGPDLLTLMGGAGQPWAVPTLFLGALVVAGLVAAIAGLVVGIPSLRLKGDYLAIVTLGFGEIIRVIFQNTKSVGANLGMYEIPGYTNFFWTFGTVILAVYIVLTLVHSTAGRGFIAVHDDEVAAEAMGINTTKYKIIAFVVGAFFAGIAGGLYGHLNLSIDPNGFGFMKSIEIVVMVILGGMANTPGVIAAAIILTLLPEFLKPVAEYRMIIYSLLLIGLMLARPQGLFSWKRRRA